MCQNTVLRDVGLAQGKSAVTLQERFQWFGIAANWGELLVVCLKESLNHTDLLFKVGVAEKASLLSGD